MKPTALATLWLLCVMAVFSCSALAKNVADRTEFGHDIRVEPGEKLGDVTCLGCTAYIRGQVTGDVTSIGGKIVLGEGAEVDGDVTCALCDVRLENGSNTGGDVTVAGGQLYRQQGAAVSGDITNIASKFAVIFLMLSPLLFLGAIVALIVWLVQRGKRTAPVPA
ncbi:MAG TPA: polymer-forming cytoskeletal protein [Terriglobales bacterium]|nr:polymer-forming cytoskeletal protein [Terriglobales bacterium]